MAQPSIAGMLTELDRTENILRPLLGEPMSDADRADIERQLRNNAALRSLVEKIQTVWA